LEVKQRIILIFTQNIASNKASKWAGPICPVSTPSPFT
jgi:hypothetical protein